MTNSEENLRVRICFVGYRDHDDEQRFEVLPFTENVSQVTKFIAGIRASGGGDLPEDVVGGLRRCLDQQWSPDSIKQVFLICDAPCHGRKYYDGWEGYPDGSPEGLEVEPLMREFSERQIAFTCIKLADVCNKMIDAMKENHTGMDVTNLTEAVKTKSAEEVTKMFVDSASYILRATVEKVKRSTRSTAAKKPVAEDLWNPEKLKTNDLFSCVSYLQVKNIEGNQVTVNNQLGGSWFISKDILNKHMWSADHFEQEVKCTMTELSEILEQCRDTIFKVQFRKKVDQKAVMERLSHVNLKDLKDEKEIKRISKGLIEGEMVQIVGHLVASENNLGRSLIIDLNARAPHNFRQVDHRSIDFIIFKNVKYSLGKRQGAAPETLPLKPNTSRPHWTESKLEVGNWFSSVCYYKIKQIVDAETVIVVNAKNPSKELRMSRDILQKEMNSASIYEKVEKVSRSNLIELLMHAKESVMTIDFRRKVDEAWIREHLTSNVSSQNQLKSTSELQKLSRELVGGKQVSLTCFTASSENKLGRSTVIDLNKPWGMNFKLVDHRTVDSVILKNTKYVVK